MLQETLNSHLQIGIFVELKYAVRRGEKNLSGVFILLVEEDVFLH